jgi:hypothetical protein
MHYQGALLLTISVVQLKDGAPQTLLQLVLCEAFGTLPVVPLGSQPPARCDTNVQTRQRYMYP